MNNVVSFHAGKVGRDVKLTTQRLSSAEEKTEWSCESFLPVWDNYTFVVSYIRF